MLSTILENPSYWVLAGLVKDYDEELGELMLSDEFVQWLNEYQDGCLLGYEGQLPDLSGLFTWVSTPSRFGVGHVEWSRACRNTCDDYHEAMRQW